VERRTYTWVPDYTSTPDVQAWAVLEHVDVGDVRVRLGIGHQDDMGSDALGPWAVIGPLPADELRGLAETLLTAADHAEAWGHATSR